MFLKIWQIAQNTKDLNIKFYCSTSHHFLLYRLDLSSIVPVTLLLCHNNELQTCMYLYG